MAATRSTPTYKLYTRRQSSDTFVLCYQIYGASMDQSSLLGEKFRHVPLGSVGCSMGSIKLDLYYRKHLVLNENSNNVRLIVLW